MSYPSPLDVVNQVLGEDLNPDNIANVANSPRQFAEQIMQFPLEQMRASDIPSLPDGHLRPFLDDRAIARPGLDWAESHLDRIFAALLYSHSAVAVDPLDTLRSAPAEADSSSVLGVLHYLAVSAPLVASGLLTFVPRPSVDRSSWRPGPWRRQKYAPNGNAEGLRRLEEKLGLDRWDPDLRPSRNLEDLWFAKNILLDRMQMVNALKGRAHFYVDHGRHLEWSNSATYEESKLIEQFARSEQRLAALRGLSAGSVRRSLDAYRHSRAASFLLRNPVPDLSVTNATDLILVHESDQFDGWRLRLDQYVNECISNPNIAPSIAADLRAYAHELDSTFSKSPALDAIRGGVGVFGISAAATTLASPLMSSAGVSDGVAVSVTAGLIETVRRIVIGYRATGDRVAVRARASVARAAAVRFQH